MSRFFAALLLNCLFAQYVDACDPYRSYPFQPDKDKKASYEDPVTGYSEKLPVLIVKEVEVIREYRGGFSCDDISFLNVKMEIPQASSYSFEDFGVYFRVIRGENILDSSAYPLEAFSMEGKVGVYKLVWVEENPENRKPLDIVIEAFVVSHDLKLGSTVKFDVKSTGGKKIID